MKQISVMTKTLAFVVLCTSVSTALAYARYNEDVYYYRLETEIPFEIRVSSPQVNLFVSELEKIFLTGYFADRNYIFEEDGKHPRALQLRISSFEEGRSVFILLRYRRLGATGGPNAVRRYMLEYRWRRVDFQGNGVSRHGRSRESGVLESAAGFLEKAFESMQIERRKLRYNAKHCAEQIVHVVEMMERENSGQRGSAE